MIYKNNQLSIISTDPTVLIFDFIKVKITLLDPFNDSKEGVKENISRNSGVRISKSKKQQTYKNMF